MLFAVGSECCSHVHCFIFFFTLQSTSYELTIRGTTWICPDTDRTDLFIWQIKSCVIIGFPFGMLIWPKKPGAAWVSFSLFQISCELAQRHLAHTIPMSYKGMQEKCSKWANLHFFNRNLFIYFSFFLFFISPGVTSCTATVNLLLSGCSSDLRFRSEMYIVGLSYSRHVGNICEGFFFFFNG